MKKYSKEIEAAIKLLKANKWVLTPPSIGTCALSECGKQFVVKRGKVGRPPSKYCCNSHMQTAHDRAAKVRVAKHRAKKRMERLKIQLKTAQKKYQEFHP